MARLFFAFRKYFRKARRPCAHCTSKQSLPKSKQFLVLDAMSRQRHGHRHFNRFLVTLDKCAASRCHVTVDSRERSDVSNDEHRAVNVASRPPLTRGRADTEICRCQVDRSHRPVYPGSLQRCLLHVLDSADDRFGRLALFLCDHTD